VDVAKCDRRPLAGRQVSERCSKRRLQKHRVSRWRRQSWAFGFVERELDSTQEPPSPSRANAVPNSYPAHPRVEALGIAEAMQAAQDIKRDVLGDIGGRFPIAEDSDRHRHRDPADSPDDSLRCSALARKETLVL
jgi:hypothetical protein